MSLFRARLFCLRSLCHAILWSLYCCTGRNVSLSFGGVPLLLLYCCTAAVGPV